MAFKMKGHSLPGINQKMSGSTTTGGRSESAPFQLKSGNNPSPHKFFGLGRAIKRLLFGNK